MNRISSSIAVAVALVASAVVSAEPTTGPAFQVYGGQGGGKGRVLNDLELTEITRIELAFQKQKAAAEMARTALAQAAWTSAPNSQDIIQKAQAIAAAEMALATSRATAFQQIKAQLKDPTPAKLAAVTRELGGTAVAPAARGAAPAVGTPGANPPGM